MVTKPTGSLLDLAREAPRITIDRLAPDGTVLIVVPHPDDETFGCGAALAAAASAGRRIAIILLTDGEGSHSQSKAYPPTKLKNLRLAELRFALGSLTGRNDIGIKQLSLADGRTGKSDLAQIDCGSLSKFAGEQGTSVVWSTWQDDPHCDHETAAILAERIAIRLGVPLWSFAVWGRFGERAVSGLTPFCFEPGNQLDNKRRAVAGYRSQTTSLIADDPNGFQMSEAIVDHFITTAEIFFEHS